MVRINEQSLAVAILGHSCCSCTDATLTGPAPPGASRRALAGAADASSFADAADDAIRASGVAIAEDKASITLGFADWKRPSPETAPVHAKAAGLYMICTLSKHGAEKKGFHDALMLDYRGYVAEATGANVFFLMDDGKIHTPDADCFLNGITRQTVIKLAKDMGYEVVERHIKPEELSHVAECFLTGTAAEVTPVSRIGDHHFNPGAFSRDIMDKYAALVRGEG